MVGSADRAGVRPTIRTIAERAGVSIATVSYVLNRRDLTDTKVKITPETRRRVLDAAEELGYTPNQNARGMRTGRTNQICLVLETVESPWSQALVTSLTRACKAAGMTLLLLVDGDWLGFLSRQGADGAIIATVPESQEMVERLQVLGERGLSIILLSDEYDELPGVDLIRQVQQPAVDEAVDLLTSRHRRIACFWAPENAESRQRLGRYREGLQRAGIPYDAVLVRETGASREQAYRDMLDLLAGRDAPTALFATNDLSAIGALWACYRRGLDVPSAFEIVGIGNTPEGRRADPPLTSVGADALYDEVAELLMRRLTMGPDAQRVHRIHWSVHHRGTTRPLGDEPVNHRRRK
ncbi:LacI family DNA-binding transcriptional regulator [Kribbella sp. CA-294648]|uniref:LacI family DNA-binding transcriptional regulator n=1 Tax=Kribbella sp. CA-294648 TaxID=3239948 RepID=UPI003D8F7237